EGSLASVLGLPGADRVHPVPERLIVEVPDSDQEAVQQALDDSKDLRRLDSQIIAKRHELRQYKTNHLPSVDLVAQYGLFARFNGYEDFFRKFQRNNVQIGISLKIPLAPSAAAVAQTAQAEAELNGLRTRVNQTRSKITLTVQNAWRQVRLLE